MPQQTKKKDDLDKKMLKLASGFGVQKILQNLHKNIQSEKWLGKNNRYIKKCITKIKIDADVKKRGIINNKHLREYIAVSTLLHCADGWKFFGKALQSHAMGDAHISRHLAYYAELRASMSLMATEGIGIFDQSHFIIDENGLCRKINTKDGTHKIIWRIMNHWSELNRSSGVLFNAIMPNGNSLDEWLTAYDSSDANKLAAGSNLLKKWGLDIKNLSRDREARNESSYRPTNIVAIDPIDSRAASRFLKDIWSMCEPSSPCEFNKLDMHLLRITLKEIEQGVSGTNPLSKNNIPKFKVKISNAIDNLYHGSKIELLEFLLWQRDSDESAIIKHANGSLPVNDPSHHMQVISRALLLLRVTTGACSKMLKDSNITKDELSFWWQEYGKNSGLWENNEEPQDSSDLWADVEAAMENITKWETTGNNSVVNFWKNESYSLTLLSETERMLFWGLGL